MQSCSIGVLDEKQGSELDVKWDLEDTTISIHHPLVSLCSLSLHRTFTDKSGQPCLPSTEEVNEVIREEDGSDHPHADCGTKMPGYRPGSCY